MHYSSARRLAASALASLALSGTLAVGANQVPNTYTGTVNVTVSY